MITTVFDLFVTGEIGIGQVLCGNYVSSHSTIESLNHAMDLDAWLVLTLRSLLGTEKISTALICLELAAR